MWNLIFPGFSFLAVWDQLVIVPALGTVYDGVPAAAN